MLRAGRFAVGLLATLLALGGCLSAPPGVDIDAGHPGDGDASIDADVPPGGAALVFKWLAKPAPQAGVGANMVIKEIRLPLRDVRAVGDAAPGDIRTSVATLDLRWDDGHAPQVLTFPLAPPGLYSRFEFRVQSVDGKGYELKGEVTVAGHEDTLKFDIHDNQMLPVSLPLSELELKVGEVENIEVSLNVAAVLAVIDWQSMQDDDGSYEIDEQSPQIGVIRAALASSFSVHVAGTP